MSGLAFTAVRGLDASRWRSLGPRTVCTGTRWLQAMGSRLPGEVHTFFLAEGGDGVPVVGAHGAVVSRPDAYEAFDLAQLLMRVPPVFELDDRVLAERASLAAGGPPPAAWLPNLVLAVPGYDGPVVGPAAGDAGLLGAFVREVLGWAGAAGLRAVGFLYLPLAPALLDALAEVGGAAAPLTVRSGLDVTWPDAAGYLASLPPHRRREVRRELRRLAERGIRTQRIDPARHLEDLVRLRCLLLEKYGHAADPDGERARLRALTAAFGPDVTAFAAWREGAMLGFSLMLRRGPAWHALLTGIDTGVEDGFVHFDTLFYAPAAVAPEMGVREISYGIGHPEAKAARGCRLTAVLGHVFGLAAGLEPAVRRACEVMARGFPYRATETREPAGTREPAAAGRP